LLTGMGALPKDIQNVVWLQTSFIGDIILTTAAMQLLRAKAPAVRQYLITTPTGAAALKGQPFIHDILVWDKRRDSLWASGQNLRRALFQRGLSAQNTVLLQVHKSIRSSLLRRLIALPTVAYEESLLGWGSFRVPRVAVFHEAARIAMLLQPLGFLRKDIIQARPRLEVIKPDHQDLLATCRQLQSFRRVVGIAPGSVWKTKRWPADAYAFVVRDLLKHADTAVVLLGAEQERQQAQKIVELLANKPAGLFDLVGKTTLVDLPFIYSHLSLLITNDSSPIHYASALAIPTLAIFGATVPAMGFAPLAPHSKVIDIPAALLACRPCSDHGPKTCPLKHFRCMNDILPQSVFSTAMAMLESYGVNKARS